MAKAEALVRQAAAAGAQIILLQELFEGLYWCQEQKAVRRGPALWYYVNIDSMPLQHQPDMRPLSRSSPFRNIFHGRKMERTGTLYKGGAHA